LAGEELEEGCSGDGVGRDDGPALAVDGCGAVRKSVGEVWEERRVRLGIEAGRVLLVEGRIVDVNYWFGGCIPLALGMPLEVRAAWLGAYQRSPQHPAWECQWQ
jgi:hypothetical protein